MGFRSTFATSDYSIDWPAWFREKYKDTIFFPRAAGCIGARLECKTYGAWDELPEDIQKAIQGVDHDWHLSFILVYLHECGGITRCQIERERISWTEPIGWRKTNEVEHHYCSGCSDAALAIA